jgi:hypothetical protein
MSLLSSARNTLANANIPGILAVAAEKSREVVTAGLLPAATQGSQWVAANPGTVVAYGAAGGAGLVCLAVPALVVAPVLGAIGFTEAGVVAGKFVLYSLVSGYKSCLPVSIITQVDHFYYRFRCCRRPERYR